jgi:hypothetical protein
LKTPFNPPPQPVIYVRVEESLREAVRELAYRRRTSVNELLTRLLTEACAAQGLLTPSGLPTFPLVPRRYRVYHSPLPNP